MTEKLAAWQRKGVPFHIWLTSPACEILDVTFAMNNGWAKIERAVRADDYLQHARSDRRGSDLSPDDGR